MHELNAHIKSECDRRTLDQNNSISHLNVDPLKIEHNEPAAESIPISVLPHSSRSLAKKRAKIELNGGGDVHHKCHECGKILAHKSTLREHQLAAHSNERPFECMLCHKT